MSSRKIIVVSDPLDKIISSICNAALKFEGLQMLSHVHAVKEAIVEEISNNTKDEE
jgi:hypothetical protein